MCKAHVLRFRCSHGVLMGFEPCRLGPCPSIKTTGAGLPQQPYKCYNCQHKAQQNEVIHTSPLRRTYTSSSADSSTSHGSFSSSSPPKSSRFLTVSHPLPGVAVQPSNCVRMGMPHRSVSAAKSFTFACHSSDHYATPHYSSLPTFLPHQDHPCPPCQLQQMQVCAETDVIQAAKAEFPNLKCEMLVSNGRTWDPEIMTKPTLEKYVDERRTEEREMWFHVTRKWTQDLKRSRVLVAEEDGLGLFA